MVPPFDRTPVSAIVIILMFNVTVAVVTRDSGPLGNPTATARDKILYTGRKSTLSGFFRGSGSR